MRDKWQWIIYTGSRSPKNCEPTKHFSQTRRKGLIWVSSNWPQDRDLNQWVNRPKEGSKKNKKKEIMGLGTVRLDDKCCTYILASKPLLMPAAAVYYELHISWKGSISANLYNYETWKLRFKRQNQNSSSLSLPRAIITNPCVWEWQITSRADGFLGSAFLDHQGHGSREKQHASYICPPDLGFCWLFCHLEDN